jgi:hypothetical protein
MRMKCIIRMKQDRNTCHFTHFKSINYEYLLVCGQTLCNFISLMVCEPMCTGFYNLLIRQWHLDNHTAKSHSVRQIVKYVWKGIAKGNSVTLQILETISTDQTTNAKGIMSWWQHAETREFSNESWTRNRRYKQMCSY